MDGLSLIVGVALGAAIGALAMKAFKGGGDADTATAVEAARQLEKQLDAMQKQLDAARAAESQAREELAALGPELEAAKQRFAEQQAFMEDVKKQLADTFAAKGQQALATNSEQFLKLADKTFAPMKDLLAKQGEAVQQLEEKRAKAYVELSTTIGHLMEGHQRLDDTTGQLASALRRPDQRGKWGEMQLRNVVELAGMVDHCDFTEQVDVDTDEGKQRPDMIVRLPGEGCIVVDAKAPLERYLEALEQPAGSPEREALLDSHAKQVDTHVRSLSAKAYWKNFDKTPELVVMFIPLESALLASLEQNPGLHAKALESKVLLATPTLLLGLLRAVSFGWRQEAVAHNAEKIAALGKDLYDRINTFLEAWVTVGSRMEKLVDAYNKSIGSMEARLLVSARELQHLGVAQAGDLPSRGPIDRSVRQLTSTPPSSE